MGAILKGHWERYIWLLFCSKIYFPVLLCWVHWCLSGSKTLTHGWEYLKNFLPLCWNSWQLELLLLFWSYCGAARPPASAPWNWRGLMHLTCVTDRWWLHLYIAFFFCSVVVYKSPVFGESGAFVIRMWYPVGTAYLLTLSNFPHNVRISTLLTI